MCARKLELPIVKSVVGGKCRVVEGKLFVDVFEIPEIELAGS